MFTTANKRMGFKILEAFPVALLFFALPHVVYAQVVAKSIGVLNIFIGLMLIAALVTYGIGLVLWATRLGSWPSYRTEAIVVLEWSVAMLFVLVVLISGIQFFQNHSQVAYRIVTGIIGISVIAYIFISLAVPKAKKPEDEEHK